jgi:hypothetical protein
MELKRQYYYKNVNSYQVTDILKNALLWYNKQPAYKGTVLALIMCEMTCDLLAVSMDLKYTNARTNTQTGWHINVD